MSVNQQRSCSKQITSQFEGYLGAIQDHEIPTNFLVHKRQIDSGQSSTANNKCHLCKINIEDVNHIISSCPKMSTWYYLSLHHDALTKYILKVIIKKNHPNERYRDLNEYESVKKNYLFPSPRSFMLDTWLVLDTTSYTSVDSV